MTDEPTPTIDLTIEVLYTCYTCGLRKAAVTVPARGPEDVVQWLEKIIRPAVSDDHKQRSFLCRAIKFDLMIPLSGAERVGDAPSN